MHACRSTLEDPTHEILEREPTDEELAEEMGLTAAQVGRLRLAAIRPASLDAPLRDEETSSLGDIVEDVAMATPYEDLEEGNTATVVQEMLEVLGEREADILRHRFGFDGRPERTLDQVGEDFEISRERVRQVQNLALSKLRRMLKIRAIGEDRTSGRGRQPY